MLYKIIDIFLAKKIKFTPENINWDDETVCALCGKKSDCICQIHLCPCKKLATECIWPSDLCPCKECEELIGNCKCTSYNEKEN